MDINIGKILIQPKDNWNATTPYEYLNLVRYNKNLYICKSVTGAPVGTLPTNTSYYMHITADGIDAQEIQLQKTATEIQWKRTGDITWTTLVALSAFKGDKGDPGPKGDQGDPGTDGITWFMGTTDPTNEGVDGDLYLNYTTWHVWEKISGTWADRGTIKGADGSGSSGVTGPSSSVDSNFVTFDGVTGKLIKDSGVKPSDFAKAVHTHGYLANVSEDTTPELGGPLDCNNKPVYWDLYAISGTTIDVANGNKQRLTLYNIETNITVSLSTPSGACAFHLFIYQGATTRTITWPAIRWLNGTAPNLAVSSGVFVVCLAWDGTRWFGSWGAYS